MRRYFIVFFIGQTTTDGISKAMYGSKTFITNGEFVQAAKVIVDLSNDGITPAVITNVLEVNERDYIGWTSTVIND